ncbi:MAG: 50S ribosomal protein L1 [Candidatus Cloacimonetes bacterium]|nr:50S ribosomal protein L1 [Candidatus Cloacimonadota bacterium]
MRRSKRYKEAVSKIDRLRQYELEEAIGILKELPQAKFDETIELHMNLGVDPRKADQQIRNSIILPFGTGKKVRVLVFADGEKADEASRSGADYVGVDDLMEKITGGWFDFDIVIATPNLMGKIGKLGKVLGPRGLMPNPKVGTVTMDVGKAVEESKSGKIAYRVDKFSNIHVPVGKMSFAKENLKENILTMVSSILRDRPATVKGQYIKSMAITSTMGPGIRLNVANTSVEAKK